MKYKIKLLNYGQVVDEFDYDDIEEVTTDYWHYLKLGGNYVSLYVDGEEICGQKNIRDIVGDKPRSSIFIQPRETYQYQPPRKKR